jgi:hypothetical protein
MQYIITITILSLILISTAHAQSKMPPKLKNHFTRRFLQAAPAPAQNSNSSANQTASGFAIPLLNQNNTVYVVNGTVGDNHQPIMFAFDINDPVTWVVGANLSSVGFGENYFDCNTSQTCVSDNFSFAVGLFGIDAEGFEVNDQIQLSNNLTTSNQSILVFANFTINNTIPSQGDNLTSGALGLGFGDNVTLSVLDNLANQGLIQQKNFSLYLSTNINDSELIIGGYDPKYMQTANFSWIPLAEQDNWIIQIANITMNGSMVATSQNVSFSTLDYVTVLPEQVYQTVYNALTVNSICTNDSGISCSCSSSDNINSFPDFAFELYDIDNNTVSLHLSPQQYVLFQNATCLTPFTYLQGSNDWVLGLSFLSSFYSMFDQTNQLIGFSPVHQQLKI